MSSTPPPPQAPGAAGAAARPSSDAASTTSSTATESDWRKSVPQSYRSSEVRAVSEVLAALEPGATPSQKLMLAMRFEDSIFQSASSLQDYRKRLTKRLKKLQKSYKPPPSGGTAGKATTTSPQEDARRKELEAEKDLRERFGKELMFIVTHAAEAVKHMRERHGDGRAEHLRQHTDNAEQWAVEIGLTEEGPKRMRKTPRQPDYLDRLGQHLKERVDNIRSHVVKLTAPDLFLEETLVKLEEDMSSQSSLLLSQCTRELLTRKGESIPAADGAGLKKLLEKAAAPVPIPRRGQSQDVTDASLAYLDKIRAASQALLAFMALTAEDKAEVPRGVLKRAHAVAVEALDHIVATYHEEDQEKSGGTSVKLEDAWLKVMEYGNEVDSTGEDGADPPPIDGTAPPNKRLRTSVGGGRAMVMRSRVLLTPGRKTPSNLLPALRREEATLIRAGGPDGPGGSRLRMEFGDAFDMTVFLVPLLVTVRALSKDKGRRISSESKTEDSLVWTSPRHGLDTLGSATAAAPLQLMGIAGNDSTLGPMVAKNLQYASCQATYVLRRCFADMAGRSYASGSEFEVEITEATALLRFLQIARETYMPGWKNRDV